MKRKPITFTPVQPKRRFDPDLKYEKQLVSILNEQKETKDEYDHYASSLAARFRTFSRKQYAEAKMEIEKALFKVEFEELYN